jgi:hypothetical protein
MRAWRRIGRSHVPSSCQTRGPCGHRLRPVIGTLRLTSATHGVVYGACIRRRGCRGGWKNSRYPLGSTDRGPTPAESRDRSERSRSRNDDRSIARPSASDVRRGSNISRSGCIPLAWRHRYSPVLDESVTPLVRRWCSREGRGCGALAAPTAQDSEIAMAHA